MHALCEQTIGRTGRVRLQVNFTPEPAKPATPLAAQLLADFKDDTADDDFKHTAPTSSTKFQYDDGPKVHITASRAAGSARGRSCTCMCLRVSSSSTQKLVSLQERSAVVQELPQSYGAGGQARAKTALEEKFPQLANSGFEPQPSWQVCL